MAQLSRIVNKVLIGVVTTAAGLTAAGCQGPGPTKQADASGRNDVTDVRPIEPTQAAAYTAPAYVAPAYDSTVIQSVPASPMMSETPVASRYTPAAQPVLAMSTVGGNAHVVRRGETLFSIAKATYGSGKEWRKIVSANPGVSAASLKVGQKLTLPN